MPNQTEKQVDNMTVQLIADRLNLLHEDVNDMRTSLRDSMAGMSTAIQKLVQLEERQLLSSQTLERALTQIDKEHTRMQSDIKDSEVKQEAWKEAIEKRVDDLEKVQPLQAQATKWMLSAVWAFAGVAVMAGLKFFGIL